MSTKQIEKFEQIVEIPEGVDPEVASVLRQINAATAGMSCRVPPIANENTVSCCSFVESHQFVPERFTYRSNRTMRWMQIGRSASTSACHSGSKSGCVSDFARAG